jgi:hypothetical protein
MSTEDQQYVIACKRVEDGKYVTSRIELCSKCQHAIYVAHSTPIHSGAIYICLQCIDWEAVEKLEPPTDKQKEDIRRFFEHDK